MRTLLFIIASLLIISLASSAIIETSAKRSIAPEARSLLFEIDETCQEFKARDFDSIWISAYRTCLPITVSTNNWDYNDLQAHYFCTTIGKHRSLVNFVEIFTGASGEDTLSPFVLSFVPSAPFRVRTSGISFARRPSCWVENDYCNATNAIVTGCKTADIEWREAEDDSFDGGKDRNDRKARNVFEWGEGHGRFERRWIANKDRVYLTSNENVSLECKSSSGCCAYIAPHQSFDGICSYEAPKESNEFFKNDGFKNDGFRKDEYRKGEEKRN